MAALLRDPPAPLKLWALPAPFTVKEEERGAAAAFLPPGLLWDQGRSGCWPRVNKRAFFGVRTLWGALLPVPHLQPVAGGCSAPLVAFQCSAGTESGFLTVLMRNP